MNNFFSLIAGSFFGREDELKLAADYLRSTNDTPIIFHGEHGCGKTATVAKIATESRAWLGNSDIEPVLILRFLGTTPDSKSESKSFGAVNRRENKLILSNLFFWPNLFFC